MTTERAKEIYRKHYEANKERIDAHRLALKTATELAAESRRMVRREAGCASGI